MVLPYIKHESATGVHVFPILKPLPPPSQYHPSGSSQCTSPVHHVSCIEPGLAIHFTYDIIHVSMPFSQIIPPSPSPTESKRLFYTSVSLCCLTYRVIITIFLNSIYMVIYVYIYMCIYVIYVYIYIYVLVYCIGDFLSGLLHSV